MLFEYSKYFNLQQQQQQQQKEDNLNKCLK